MEITVVNKIYAKDYHEAHQKMLDELYPLRYKVIEGTLLESTLEFRGGDSLFPLMYEWRYRANVR